MTEQHNHPGGSNYECSHPQCRAGKLISTSVEDLRSSLLYYTTEEDLKVLEIALSSCRRGKYKTKAKMIEAHIKRLGRK